MMKYLLTAFAIFLSSVTVSAQSVSEFEADYIELQVQGSGGTIRMGETAEVARFRLSNRADKAITLNRLKLRNYGSADLDESFENFQIRNNGVTLTSQFIADRNNVTFTFNNVFIDRGDSLVLSVVGRLIYAQSGETVELGIRRQEDVQASMVGLDFFSLECRECEGLRAQEKRLRAGGIYIRNTSPFRSARYYGSARRTSASSLFNRSYGSSQNQTTRRSNSATSRFYYRPPSRQSFGPGARDIRFFSTFINSKVDTQVEGVFLTLGSGSQATDKNGNNVANEITDFSETFSDFTLWVNNQREDTTNDFTTRNGKIGLLFNTTFDIPANAQLLVTGRISNQAVNGDRVRFSLARDGLIDPIYLYNGDSVESGNINGGSSNAFRTTTNEPLSITR